MFWSSDKPDMLKPLIEFCKYYEDPVKKVTYENSKYYVRWKEVKKKNTQDFPA